MKEKLLQLISDESCKDVTLDTRIDDLGLDSLEFVELMLRINNAFGEISNEQYANVRTVNDILDILDSRIPA